MKGFLLVAIGALILVSTPGRASAQPAHPHRAKADLTISSPLFVGTTLVKPGDYKVQCVDVQGKDFLVVTSLDTGKEVARVPCKPEILSEKVTGSSFVSIARDDGTRELRSVRIKGETIAHAVAN